MPKARINTLSSFSIGGNTVSVTSVFCEDGTITKNSSKEVGVFNKYASKKSIVAECKYETVLDR